MKKKFVKVSLFCALVATASTGFVACADYDDDIKNLQEQVDANKTLAETLDAQIQDLKTALETANADIQAAKDAAAAAQEAADKANELAKQAAAEAKAEAIEEATKLVEALKADIEAKNYATTEELNAAITTVNSKIASIEEGLNGKIDGINTTIEGLDGRVSKTEELIEELKTQKLAVETFEQYKKEAALEIDSLDEKIDSVKTALEKAITDAEKKAQEAADAAEDAANVYTDKEIEALRTDLEKQISAVNTNLVTLLTQSLRSLVFVPNLYVDGIEAVEYDYLPYEPFKTFASKKADITTNEGEKSEISGVYGDGYSYDYALDDNATTLFINPSIDVEYKMNPSSVSQSSIEKMEWSILERDVEVVARGAVDGNNKRIHITNVAKSSSEASSLVLTLWADGNKIASQSDKTLEAIEKANGDGENDATIFALQSKKTGDDETPDQIVTSDYAMLYASKLKLRAIAYKDGTTVTPENDANGNNADCSLPLKNGKTTELYEAPVHAIENPASFQIQYNATDLTNSTLKLRDKIQIHYDWISNTGKNGQCKTMTLTEAETKYGFKVKFNRVNYTVGATSKTADSQYLLINENGDLAVCGINSDGSQNKNDKNPVDAIGRHPLVQVLLTKEVEEGGKMVEKVVLDGYIKIEIAREIKNKETACFDLGNVAFGCEEVEKSLTWSQISAQLLREAAVTSREEFDALYEIELDGAGEIAQYVRNTKDYDAAAENYVYDQLSDANKFGVVSKSEDAGQGTSTTILTWTLRTLPCDLQRIYESKADEGERSGATASKMDHAKTIYVKYRPIVKNPDATREYPGIFLPLTIGVDKPQATISGKIPSVWYEKDGNGEYTTIRVNVVEGTSGMQLTGAADEITKKLNAVWDGDHPTFDGLDSKYFTSYANVTDYANKVNGAGGYNYYFTAANNKEVAGASGQKYTLSVAQVWGNDHCDGFANKLNITAETELANAFSTLDSKNSAYANVRVVAKKSAADAGQTIVVLDKTTGTITYQDNDYAKDILNAFAHDDIENSIRFNLGIYAYSTCDIAMSLKNNTFDAMVQRPVDIEGNKDVVFVDATDDGASIEIAKIFTFEDWRNLPFVANVEDIAGSNAWYFGFYNFTDAKMLEDQITTTLGLENAENQSLLDSENVNKFKDVNSIIAGQIKQVQTNTLPISNPVKENNVAIYNKVVNSFGKIVYNNGNNNVKTFWLRIPVAFEYAWGTIVASVDVKVENTMGN